MTDQERQELLAEGAAYFRKNMVYHSVFEQMRKKWKTYGRITGKITLVQPSEQEREVLGGFLGKFFSGKKLSFAAAEFEQALLQTKFAGLTLESLLEAYFGEVLVTNEEAKKKQAEAKMRFFEQLYEQMAACYDELAPSVRWLAEMKQQKKHGYQLLLSEYQASPEHAGQVVQNVCHGLERIFRGTVRTMRLALLGAEITRNPHTFDRKNTEGKLLIQALGYLSGNLNYQTAEEIFLIYHNAGLVPDDISSFTTAYGISFYTGENEHPAYRGFIDNFEPYVVTLSNLSHVERADCPQKKVYIVENQMVFSHMCAELQSEGVALMCTSGQIKTASLMVIDLLCEAGCEIFYAGDFDPEGVTIADRIIRRNPRLIRPWRMSADDYKLAISNERIDEMRMLKLVNVQDVRLFEICDAIREQKRAGYQEQLVAVMLADIKGG